MALWKKFYDAHVVLDEDRKVFYACVFLMAFALVLAAADAVSLFRGQVNLNEHVPFFLATVVFAITQVCLYVLRRA